MSVFWRDVPQGGPDDREPKPRHSEIVSVPLGAKGINDYLKDGNRNAWRWDFLDDCWMEVRSSEIHPGILLMLDKKQGGYSPEFG